MIVSLAVTSNHATSPFQWQSWRRQLREDAQHHALMERQDAERLTPAQLAQLNKLRARFLQEGQPSALPSHTAAVLQVNRALWRLQPKLAAASFCLSGDSGQSTCGTGNTDGCDSHQFMCCGCARTVVCGALYVFLDMSNGAAHLSAAIFVMQSWTRWPRRRRRMPGLRREGQLPERAARMTHPKMAPA